ncbi:MAG TPA: SpvB/TcaC N-terminal domain-containing protein [Polyangiaceae bacterium]|nr:SpvB/TcaC N-terminal domain-containing protein [Polyangiaceae bacterium]
MKRVVEGDKNVTAPGPLAQPLALPTGEAKTGVSGKAISVPQGAGTLQGMGESYSAQLSTGDVSFSVPFSLLRARGTVQPSLGLSYSASSGVGIAGVGWSIPVPFIARQTDRGVPNYGDGANYQPQQDHFVFGGGQELVPVCTVKNASCAEAPGEVMPSWATGAQYFRPRIEGSFLRFFWSMDHRTWRVQDKAGGTMEFGVPLDGSGDTSALDTNPNQPDQVYRWHIVRHYDAQGVANPDSPLGNPQPNNVIIFRYLQNDGQAYLVDIFDTTPSVSPATTDTTLFAHHTRLTYEQRTDPTASYRSGWRIGQNLRLKRVDVSSKAYGAKTNSARHQVRRYHLEYSGQQHASLLSQVQMEGRCSASEGDAPSEISGPADAGTPPSRATAILPELTNCEKLPPITFDYTHVKGTASFPGFEAFDHTLHVMQGSPSHSLDEQMTDLFDINGDALPDVLNTQVGLYGNGHGVFFNSPRGNADTFAAVTPMAIRGVLGANAGTITFQNGNIAPLDLDGDGRLNLVHTPPKTSDADSGQTERQYADYSPTFGNGGWYWQGRVTSTPPTQSRKLDFGKNTSRTKVADVNGDGLVDVVVSTGTEYQTFFSLARAPGGTGLFGSILPNAALSSDAVAKCVPGEPGTPLQFDDPHVHIAEMNGDGLPDVVRIERGDIRYWPGRGDGSWGTGDRRSCVAGSFASKAYVAMGGPEYSDTEGVSLRIDDVNGDGLDDLVQIRYDAVDVWLNIDGKGWTDDRHIIAGTPKSATLAQRVRLVDINGSGTPDILWGNAAAPGYQYIDLEGGQKTHLLSHVENGLGRSVDLEYTTSTAEMLAAESKKKCDRVADADLLATSPWSCAWTMKMPLVAQLLKRVTESDNLSVAGTAPAKTIVEYEYRDPLYEGRQREFRGFTRARTKRIGDANSPTDYTDSAFLLGECEDETPEDGKDSCADRSFDNPREALKGLTSFTEQYDDRGVFLSTVSHTYRLRQLIVGLDGRVVREAVASANRRVMYDTAAGPQSAPTASTTAVVYLETERPSATWDPTTAQIPNDGAPSDGETASLSRTEKVPLRATTGTAVLRGAEVSDYFGNRVVSVNFGCTSGDDCPAAQGMSADEAIVEVTKVARIDEASGWLWRTQESWISGSTHTTKRSHAYVEYDAFGNPIELRSQLEGSVDLFRTNPGGATAPIPETRAHDGMVAVAKNSYDPLGLLLSEVSPNSNDFAAPASNAQCRTLGYSNDAYAEFPDMETIHTSGGCESNGIAALSQVAVYDRGFSVPVGVLNMQLQNTAIEYDGLGRMTAIKLPKPDDSAGGASDKASIKLSYVLPSASNPVKYSVIRTQTQDGAALDEEQYLDSYRYVDGLGRTRLVLNEADPSAHDLGAYVVSGVQLFDAKGAVSRKYMNYFSDADPLRFPAQEVSSVSFGRQRYDAFGRQVQTFDLDGTVTLQSVYHALSSDLYDAADLQNGPHQGSYASARSDGHGRSLVTTERVHVNGALEARETRLQYLPTGEVESIARVRVGKSDPVVMRWMRYDSLGRLVLNVDPNTSQNFTTNLATDATASATGLRAWRYAYDYAGQMVGTSDARGCGENFTYDSAGRILTEDYSPCGSQGAYSAPNDNVSSGLGPSGYEVIYKYDRAPQYPFENCTSIERPSEYATKYNGSGSSNYLRGRLVAVWSLGQAEWDSYDGRGRVTQTAVIPALPRAIDDRVPASGYFAQRFGKRAYYRDFKFDAANREISATTGSTVAELEGTANADGKKSAVMTDYSKRGTIKKIRSTYGDLVTDITRAADGLVEEVIYGDAAGTRTDTDYDTRRRLRNIQTYRGPPQSGIWSTPPANYTPAPSPGVSTLQMVLQDQQLSYDVVGNPTEIRDYRSPEDWPSGAKPVTRKIQYDDLYRVTRVDYQVATGTDSWVSPVAADQSGPNDTRRATPASRVSFATRPLFETFGYDWLGNTLTSDDDAHGFFDRSLGVISNDTAAGQNSHPYQLKSASNEASSGSRTGSVAALYDEMGNVTRLNLKRNGACVPAGAACSSRWDLQYDELGRLSRVFRVDMPAASLPPITTDVTSGTRRDLMFLYDENDERIVKMSTYGNAYSTTLYPYDTLEVRGTALETNAGGVDAALNAGNEVPYLVSHGVRVARVVYEAAGKGEPRLGPVKPSQHVFFELSDDLGSNGIVIDKATSELVEASTYRAYGAKEADYRPDRWQGFREDHGFTGKEEDTEFGLVYFGKRFFLPELNRWLSPDPLAVHSPGEADLNLYAYVKGAVLRSIDPLGLQDAAPEGKAAPAPSGSAGGTVAGAAKAGAVGGGSAGVGFSFGIAAGEVPFLGAVATWAVTLAVDKFAPPSVKMGFGLGLAASSGVLAAQAGPEITGGGAAAATGVGSVPGAVAVVHGAGALVGAAANAGAGAWLVAKSKKPPAKGAGPAKAAAPKAAKDDFRGRYQESLRAAGKKELPKEWDAHHRIPQEFKDHPEFKDFDFDDPSNIRGVSSYRNGGKEYNVHNTITQEWAEFRENTPKATRAQIEAFAEKVDKKWSYTYFTGTE